MKELVIYGALAIIIAMVAAFGTYKFYKVQAYNKLINNANKYMDSGNYDQAIAMFNEALKYKNDSNVKRSVILAESLLSSQKSYEQAAREMENKDYLKAIEDFKKVVKEDSKRYEEAQKKIEECKKAYIALNIMNASDAAKNNKYDEANKYLEDILKLDSENAEAKKLKDTYLNIAKEEAIKNKEESKEQVTKGPLTADQAVKIIVKYINLQGTKTQFAFDHEDSRTGVSYYVIQAFDNMEDHIATSGWYYVDKNNGKAYEWDLATDKLIPLN